MARETRAQREREREEKLRAAFDAGCDHFTTRPEALMTDVHRFASAHFGDKDEALEFALGYATARSRHDEYLREKK